MKNRKTVFALKLKLRIYRNDDHTEFKRHWFVKG